MSLDITFFDEHNQQLRWSNPLLIDFPFEKKTEVFPELRLNGKLIDEAFTITFLSGIVGMLYIKDGFVSFQGRSYNNIATRLQLPYSFDDDLTKEQLKKQSSALYLWIQTYGTTHCFDDHTFERIQNLSKLLTWASSKKLGTRAS